MDRFAEEFMGRLIFMGEEIDGWALDNGILRPGNGFGAFS